MHEVYLFVGFAVANPSKRSGYPTGERHAVLVFSRQSASTEHDWKLAASHLERNGWTNIEWQQASKVDLETFPNLDETLRRRTQPR